MDAFVPRRLSFHEGREHVIVDAEAALTDPRLAGRPLILLGEAGSGKSELMRHWGGASVVTAAQVTNGWRSSQGRSFVDGLDEAAGLKDGDALHKVLGALEAQSNTDFVLACRVADWRSASATAAIKLWTGIDPVELGIEALERDAMIAFLESRSDLSQAEAGIFVDYYESLGLDAWLGNPQTLKMLATVAAKGERPGTTGALFYQYADHTWQEHRKQSGALATASKDEVLDALGALFAALIIGGYDALTVAPGEQRGARDLSLAECKRLPGVTSLSGAQIEGFLSSRLVAGEGPDRFTYQHRRIGEYLCARWLAAQATTVELRTRLLGALQHNGVVPSGLRGLWGWLADDSALAIEVVATDPLAVIDYGNADTFGPDPARALLIAIEAAEDRHEAFGWRDYRAASLVQPQLAAEVESVLAVTDESRFWTQMIILRQLRDAGTVKRYEATLRAMMLDEARQYGTRDAAADALADHGGLPDWPAIVRQLANGQDRQSLRLALVMMMNPNVGLTLTDAEFAETVYAYSGLTPRFSGHREVGTVSLYHLGRRQAIGDDRLDNMLDTLADCAVLYGNDGHDSNAWDVDHLFYALLERRLALAEPIDPDALWRWLRAGKDEHYSGSRDALGRIGNWLKQHDEVRNALQRKVLAQCADDPRSLHWHIRETALGLLPTIDDVIVLLNWLPKGDLRWRELLWFAPVREEGQRARDAAARHVLDDEDGQRLAEHADPPPREWEKQERKRQAQLAATQAARKSEIRADYLTHRDRVRRGDSGAIAGPAQIYMARVYEADRDLPPEGRIAAWIGDDLQVDIFAGFELFLTADPPSPPTATQIAESHANSRTWRAALIIVAALNERFRTGSGVADLPDERVQAGLLELVGGLFHDEEWKPLRKALSQELRRRGVWEA